MIVSLHLAQKVQSPPAPYSVAVGTGRLGGSLPRPAPLLDSLASSASLHDHRTPQARPDQPGFGCP